MNACGHVISAGVCVTCAITVKYINLIRTTAEEMMRLPFSLTRIAGRAHVFTNDEAKIAIANRHVELPDYHLVVVPWVRRKVGAARMIRSGMATYEGPMADVLQRRLMTYFRDRFLMHRPLPYTRERAAEVLAARRLSAPDINIVPYDRLLTLEGAATI